MPASVDEVSLDRVALVCPDCRNALEDAPVGMRCVTCGREFARHDRQLDLRPRRALPPSETDLGSKFQGRAARLGGWRRRLHDALYFHPVRFIGDRQRARGKNVHDALLRFAGGGGATVLDLGSGDRRIAPHVTTADLAEGARIDLRVDAHRLPFADASWDRVILQHVLEHVSEPRTVIAEVARVLRPGGLVYVEVPFVFPIHDRADHRRWTISGLSADLAPLRPVESGITIGPFSALAVVIRAAATHRLQNPYVATAVDLLAGWVLAPLSYFDRVVRPVEESQILAGAVYVVAERPA